MKKTLKKIALSLLAVSLTAAALTACGSGGADKGTTAAGKEADGKKVLKVAMECSYAPYNWTQPNDANGAVPISGGFGSCDCQHIYLRYF